MASGAQQADDVAAGIGEHGHPPHPGQRLRLQRSLATEPFGPGERGVDVVDLEVDDEPGVRAVRTGLADAARRRAAVSAHQRVGIVDGVHRPAEQPPLGIGMLTRPWPARRMPPGDRYQAIRSAPGRSRPGASAASRTLTFSSFAASPASVTASRNRRRPSSAHTARHGSPATRGGYTVIPPPTSTTTRSEPRTDSRVSPLTRADPRAFPLPEARREARSRAGCVVFVLILGFAGATGAMAFPLFLQFAQVRGLADAPKSGGQGRGRTADLPLFRRTLIPTELPDRAWAVAVPWPERSRRDLNPRPPP